MQIYTAPTIFAWTNFIVLLINFDERFVIGLVFLKYLKSCLVFGQIEPRSVNHFLQWGDLLFW